MSSHDSRSACVSVLVKMLASIPWGSGGRPSQNCGSIDVVSSPVVFAGGVGVLLGSSASLGAVVVAVCGGVEGALSVVCLVSLSVSPLLLEVSASLASPESCEIARALVARVDLRRLYGIVKKWFT